MGLWAIGVTNYERQTIWIFQMYNKDLIRWFYSDVHHLFLMTHKRMNLVNGKPLPNEILSFTYYSSAEMSSSYRPIGL